MSHRWIKNFDALATTKQRLFVLELIEAALNTIDTEQVIRKHVRVDGTTLSIKNECFDLAKYRSVRVIGFGKVACKAAAALETVLGDHITAGVVIGLAPGTHGTIQSFGGTHPRPSVQNVENSRRVIDLATGLSEHDLVIVIASGGGSSLLCWPEEECQQSERLYDAFLKTGATIRELNLVRKHLSQLKGGGLAKLLYPARVAGLIFCDIPGNNHDLVASGPTFPDASTVADAQRIIDQYGLGIYTLTETPKDERYFKNVSNVPMVTSADALGAMADAAQRRGITSRVLSTKVYDEPSVVLRDMKSAARETQLILAGGEVSIPVRAAGGTGGRNLMLAMHAFTELDDDMVFTAVASDGLDNGPAAGAIVDAQTRAVARERGIDVQKYIDSCQAQAFFEQADNVIMTGPTEANVSDLMILYRHA